jgi:two-component system, cell cycle response regulator
LNPETQQTTNPLINPSPENGKTPKRIVIVEDDTEVRQSIGRFLKEYDYEIFEAGSGPEGLAKATIEKPDVILIDLRLPGMDGLTLVRELRKRAGTVMIPIIIITAASDLYTRINVFKAGADGLMIKPFDVHELLARVERAVEVSVGFSRLTNLDALTEIFNRRYFNNRLESEYSRARRHRHSISLAMIDIDFFKHFNDTYGHQAGDFVLRSVAQFIKQALRVQDIVCRYGGEEFTAIMPVTSKPDAVMVMDRIRASIAQQPFIMEPDTPVFNVRISVGIAEFPADAVNENDLIRFSDQALYQAKNTGRDKVVAYFKEP